MLYFAYTAKIGNPTDWSKVGVIVAIAIPIIGFIIFTIKAYFRLDAVEKSIDTDIKPELKTLRISIDNAKTDLAGRIDKIHDYLLSLKTAQSDILLDQSGVTESNSPRQLTDKGMKILNESGIKEIVDSKLSEIITAIQERKPSNDYQVEQYVIDEVQKIGLDTTYKEKLEEGAFNSGSGLAVVLLVGAIYIRDQVLAAVELNPEQKKK